MNHKTPSQQKRFDDLYELYHFNPFHDKMGRFARSSGAARGYVGKDGRLTEKAMRRLNVVDTKSATSGGDSDDGGKGDGEGKKKDKKAKIRVDSTGRVVAEDQNKAISEIEKQISKDYSDKSKLLNDSSRLVNDLNRFSESTRNRTAKNKAAREDLSSMSNEELKSYIDKRTERMNLERKYREIKENDYNRGRDHLDDMLDTAGKLLALGATAATIAATIHTLKS
jgi:hypothetical protein